MSVCQCLSVSVFFCLFLSFSAILCHSLSFSVFLFLLISFFVFLCLSVCLNLSYLQLCVIGAAREPTDAALSARHCWQFELKPDPEGSPSRNESNLDEHSGMVHITCGCWENEAGGWMSGGGRGCMRENQLILFNLLKMLQYFFQNIYIWKCIKIYGIVGICSPK